VNLSNKIIYFILKSTFEDRESTYTAGLKSSVCWYRDYDFE